MAEGKGKAAVFEQATTRGDWRNYDLVCASKGNPLVDLSASFNDHSPLVDKARLVTFQVGSDEIHLSGFAPDQAGAYSLDIVLSSGGADLKEVLGKDVRVYHAQIQAHDPFSRRLADYIYSVFTKHACLFGVEQPKVSG